MVNTDEGWKEDGHPLVGQRVIRIFPEIGVSYGRITKWLPADEDAGDDSLFHVLHDADGDEEDLEEAEAEEAVQTFKKQTEDGQEPPKVVPQQPKHENWLERSRALRITPSSLGIAGTRTELLNFEEVLAPHLRRAGSAWDTPEGARSMWLLSCRSSDSVVELAQARARTLQASASAPRRARRHTGTRPPRAQLLVTLEAAVYDLQTARDVEERKPWRSEGSEHIRKHARRFFPEIGTDDNPKGASDGKIVGWLPPEGDDPALWHMVRAPATPPRAEAGA